MGAGYDIGLSNATANSTPQNQSAGTVFNFNSVGTSFDGGTQSAYGPATATATTKSPGAAIEAGANPNARNPDTNPGIGFSIGLNGVDGTTLAIGALVIAAGLALYLYTK